MKVGFVSDAHGNPHGLKICLTRLRALEVDEIYFLGDAVGYFPDAKRTIDLLESESVNCLLGNHEAMLMGYLPVDMNREEVFKISQTRQRLDKWYLEQIESWGLVKDMEIDGRRIRCVHGSPWNPLNGYVYPDSDMTGFLNYPFDLFFLGHTHRPFIRKLGPAVVVNVGSSSISRDQGNLSCCCVYDSRQETVTIFRIPFDENEVIDLYRDRISPEVVDVLRRKHDSGIMTEMVENLR